MMYTSTGPTAMSLSLLGLRSSCVFARIAETLNTPSRSAAPVYGARSVCPQAMPSSNSSRGKGLVDWTNVATSFVFLTPPRLGLSLALAVSSYVEVWGRGGRELRALDFERMTVGTLESNDLVVDADGVSRVHAVFERFGDAWCVRDLGSRNGTFVNGGRIIGEQRAALGRRDRPRAPSACCSAGRRRPVRRRLRSPSRLRSRRASVTCSLPCAVLS